MKSCYSKEVDRLSLIECWRLNALLKQRCNSLLMILSIFIFFIMFGWILIGNQSYHWVSWTRGHRHFPSSHQPEWSFPLQPWRSIAFAFCGTFFGAFCFSCCESGYAHWMQWNIAQCTGQRSFLDRRQQRYPQYRVPHRWLFYRKHKRHTRPKCDHRLIFHIPLITHERGTITYWPESLEPKWW